MNIRQGYALVLKEFERGKERGICACIWQVLHHHSLVDRRASPDEWRKHPMFKHWVAFRRDVKLARHKQGHELEWYIGYWMQRTKELGWCGTARARRIRVLKCLARGHRAEAIKQACI